MAEHLYEYVFLCKGGSFVSGSVPAENKDSVKQMIEDWYADDDELFQIKKWLSIKKESKKQERKRAILHKKYQESGFEEPF